MTTRIPITKENGNSGSGINNNPPTTGVGLEDRQKQIWKDMEADMERRRREWEDEIDKMRKQFLLLRPDADALGLKDGGDLATSGLEAAGEGVGGVGVGGVGGGSVGGGSGGGGSSGGGGGVVVLDSQSWLGSGEEEEEKDWRSMVVKDEGGHPLFRVTFDVREYQPEEVSVKMDAHKVWVSAKRQSQQGGSSLSRQYSREVRLPSQLDPLTLQCLMGHDGMLTVEAPLPAATYAALKEATAFPPFHTGPAPSSAPTTTTTTITPLQQQSSSSSSSSATSSSSFQASYQPLPHNAAPSSYLQQPPGLPPSDPVLPPYQPPRPDPVVASFPRPDPYLTSGFQPVSAAPVHRCQPVLPDLSTPAFAPSPASSSLQPHKTTSSAFSAPSSSSSPPYRDTSSPELSGFSAPSPPFHSLPSQEDHLGGGAALNGVSRGDLSSPDIFADPGKFKLEVDIEDYRPEELTVKTQDRKVVVCARREEKVGNRSSSREMSREHTLPESVDPLTIKAFFTDGGKLVIEAPFREGGLLPHLSGR